MTEPRYDDDTGNLFKVQVTGYVELAFDERPTEAELRFAALDNLIYYIDAIGREEIAKDDTSVEVVVEWTGDETKLS